jgi:hypothetical protein
MKPVSNFSPGIVLMARNIVFLSHSIFVEGVVSRLRQQPFYDSVHFIDPESSNFLEEISDLEPQVVVINADIGKESPFCHLCELLSAFPQITILRLKAQERDIQVIHSSQHFVKDVQDLIDLLGTNR